MRDPMFEWPLEAKYDREIPRERIYEHGRVNADLRGRFDCEIARITWAYKLASVTINLADAPQVPEVQVVEVRVRGADIPIPVLAAIDRTIQTPVVFEVTRRLWGEDEVRMIAALKQLAPDPARGRATRISPYFATEWQPSYVRRLPLPVASDLLGLYAGLVGSMVGAAARPGEELTQTAVRFKAVEKLSREINSLEHELRGECQVYRMIALRKELREKRAQLRQQR